MSDRAHFYLEGIVIKQNSKLQTLGNRKPLFPNTRQFNKKQQKTIQYKIVQFIEKSVITKIKDNENINNSLLIYV